MANRGFVVHHKQFSHRLPPPVGPHRTVSSRSAKTTHLAALQSFSSFRVSQQERGSLWMGAVSGVTFALTYSSSEHDRQLPRKSPMCQNVVQPVAVPAACRSLQPVDVPQSDSDQCPTASTYACADNRSRVARQFLRGRLWHSSCSQGRQPGACY